MEKRGIIVFGVLFLFLVFSSMSVLADENETASDLDFDEGRGYDWLIEQLEANNWGSDVEAISWAVLALYSSDYEEYQAGVDRLRDLESENNWGNAFMTSMAVLALNTVGEDVEDEVLWLVDQQQPNFGGGNWLIQFNPPNNQGYTCNIFYGPNQFSVSMIGLNMTLEGCSLFEGSWIGFESCIKGEDAGIHESLEIQCQGGDVPASLLYYLGGSFFIIDEDDLDGELEIENGCFFGPVGDCGCYYSQFGSWALEEASDDGSYSIPYLRTSCSEDILGNSFLYLLTGGNSYRDWLLSEEGQSTDGSFGPNNVELTALAVIALGSGSYGSVSEAIDWLEFTQDRFTGSWDQDVGLTGMVLYALNRGGGTHIPTYGDDCGNGVIDDYEDCELNSDCNGSLICSNSCQCITESSLCTSDDDCEQDFTCNLYTGECEYGGAECNNNLDCAPGYFCNTINGQCEAEEVIPSQEDECSTDIDCPTGYECEFGSCRRADESSWVTWVIAILVVIVVLGLGWFAYKKFIKGRKKGGGTGSPVFVPKRPSSPGYPVTRSNVPARAPVRGTGRGEAKLEKDLDKALKKAKELVGR